MGAGPNYVLDKGFQANEALTQYYLVKLVTASEGYVDQSDTTNEVCIGVTQEACTAADATSGKIVDVRIMGVSTCVASQAVNLGELVRSSGAGKVSGLAGAAKQKVLGIALTAAGADGDQFDVLLTPLVEVDNS